MHAVAALERIFLPLLKEAEEMTASEYPKFEFNSGSSSIGSLTDYKAHCVWLECVFPDAADHEANSVAIMITVMHITTEPKLCEASVGWGQGQHPEHTIELLEHPIVLTEHQLQQTAMHFPELLRVFRNALKAWDLR